MPTTIRPLSRLFLDLENSLKGEYIAISELLETFHERGFGFFLMLFALPLALPIPKPPGMATVMSFPLMLLTAQQSLGFHRVWFPQRILRQSLHCATVKKMIDITLPWFQWAERILHPRLGFMTEGGFSHFNGICGLLMALSVLFPMPGSNMVPCIGIIFMGAGVIMRDGLAIILGIIVGIGWMIFFYALLVIFGMEGIEIVKNFIFSML